MYILAILVHDRQTRLVLINATNQFYCGKRIIKTLHKGLNVPLGQLVTKETNIPNYRSNRITLFIFRKIIKKTK